MARGKNSGNGQLQEAMGNLLQSQALLVKNQAALLAQVAESERYRDELNRINTERFARIEAMLTEHSRILTDHNRILIDLTRQVESLRDAVRDKIGFKGS